MADQQLAFILVGDHLGQVKKVLLPSNEISLLADCAQPTSSNPVVSIEPFGKRNKQLIANKNGELYIYDCISDETLPGPNGDDGLVKALPAPNKQTVFIYDKRIVIGESGPRGGSIVHKKKKESTKNAKLKDDKVAIVGEGIPLRIYDIQTRAKVFDAEPPERDWLGLQHDTYVAGLDFVGRTRVATCSKSDSVIRIYDTQGKTKPIISVDINQTAFNEYADAARFHSVASTGDDGHTVVVGSNVGQILAIDLRFNVKAQPKKRKLQPKTYKVLGSFKGARGCSIKDVKIVPDGDDGHKVLSCGLDRYLRIHNFNERTRQLDRHVYLTTKPTCCSPVFYAEP